MRGRHTRGAASISRLSSSERESDAPSEHEEVRNRIIFRRHLTDVASFDEGSFSQINDNSISSLSELPCSCPVVAAAPQREHNVPDLSGAGIMVTWEGSIGSEADENERRAWENERGTQLDGEAPAISAGSGLERIDSFDFNSLGSGNLAGTAYDVFAQQHDPLSSDTVSIGYGVDGTTDDH